MRRRFQLATHESQTTSATSAPSQDRPAIHSVGGSSIIPCSTPQLGNRYNTAETLVPIAAQSAEFTPLCSQRSTTSEGTEALGAAISLASMTETETRIVLYDFTGGELIDLIVDHPGQPADYIHTDGTLWTWRERLRPIGGVIDESGGRRGGTHLRVYDLVTPSTDSK